MILFKIETDKYYPVNKKLLLINNFKISEEINFNLRINDQPGLQIKLYATDFSMIFSDSGYEILNLNTAKPIKFSIALLDSFKSKVKDINLKENKLPQNKKKNKNNTECKPSINVEKEDEEERVRSLLSFNIEDNDEIDPQKYVILDHINSQIKIVSNSITNNESICINNKDKTETSEEEFMEDSYSDNKVEKSDFNDTILDNFDQEAIFYDLHKIAQSIKYITSAKVKLNDVFSDCVAGNAALSIVRYFMPALSNEPFIDLREKCGIFDLNLKYGIASIDNCDMFVDFEVSYAPKTSKDKNKSKKSANNKENKKVDAISDSDSNIHPTQIINNLKYNNNKKNIREKFDNKFDNNTNTSSNLQNSTNKNNQNNNNNNNSVSSNNNNNSSSSSNQNNNNNNSSNKSNQNNNNSSSNQSKNNQNNNNNNNSVSSNNNNSSSSSNQNNNNNSSSNQSKNNNNNNTNNNNNNSNSNQSVAAMNLPVKGEGLRFVFPEFFIYADELDNINFGLNSSEIKISTSKKYISSTMKKYSIKLRFKSTLLSKSEIKLNTYINSQIISTQILMPPSWTAFVKDIFHYNKSELGNLSENHKELLQKIISQNENPGMFNSLIHSFVSLATRSCSFFFCTVGEYLLSSYLTKSMLYLARVSGCVTEKNVSIAKSLIKTLSIIKAKYFKDKNTYLNVKTDISGQNIDTDDNKTTGKFCHLDFRNFKYSKNNNGSQNIAFNIDMTKFNNFTASFGKIFSKFDFISLPQFVRLNINLACQNFLKVISEGEDAIAIHLDSFQINNQLLEINYSKVGKNIHGLYDHNNINNQNIPQDNNNSSSTDIGNQNNNNNQNIIQDNNNNINSSTDIGNQNNNNNQNIIQDNNNNINSSTNNGNQKNNNNNQNIIQDNNNNNIGNQNNHQNNNNQNIIQDNNNNNIGNQNNQYRYVDESKKMCATVKIRIFQNSKKFINSYSAIKSPIFELIKLFSPKKDSTNTQNTETETHENPKFKCYLTFILRNYLYLTYDIPFTYKIHSERDLFIYAEIPNEIYASYRLKKTSKNGKFEILVSCTSPNSRNAQQVSSFKQTMSQISNWQTRGIKQAKIYITNDFGDTFYFNKQTDIIIHKGAASLIYSFMTWPHFLNMESLFLKNHSQYNIKILKILEIHENIRVNYNEFAYLDSKVINYMDNSLCNNIYPGSLGISQHQEYMEQNQNFTNNNNNTGSSITEIIRAFINEYQYCLFSFI
ncbi:hypothetical protein EDEG_03935 [Edhazardia aedis USNM 41457]|uniref:Uncharacterized protein n=1 Tax=Edhazardia aedis (strain USNM 41457) TaxID=1003232 RepID=J8ZP48_EDHAE|nr:hypothetical protein EDEG_03935 [Edhazardia aedis USNM 41457]|eukprot:EJW01483.1 hypothetical protein EDEG_03935 [Edhazardia aedis USNM 41457]